MCYFVSVGCSESLLSSLCVFCCYSSNNSQRFAFISMCFSEERRKCLSLLTFALHSMAVTYFNFAHIKRVGRLY